MVSRSSIELANKRGEQLRREFPRAASARYDRASGKVVVELSSKLTLSFSPRDAQGLENAQPAELEEIELSPSGFGVHFPSVITSKAANSYHFKTGQRDWPSR